MDAYLDSLEFRALAPLTQSSRRGIALHIAADRGRAPVAAIEPRHIEKDIRAKGGSAARNRLKVWRSLLAFLKREQWRKDDPSRDVAPPKHREQPHQVWTAEDIAAFRATWAHGTQERLAMELLYWTGARRSNVVRLGWQNLRGGWISWRQEKTRATVEIPIDPDLAEALRHADRSRLTFLETAKGAARTANGFGEWWRTACNAAGVSARAHGMRHAMGADAAESGISPHGIGAALGHTSSRESETYTKHARRRKMAAATIHALGQARRLESRKPKLETGEQDFDSKG